MDSGLAECGLHVKHLPLEGPAGSGNKAAMPRLLPLASAVLLVSACGNTQDQVFERAEADPVEVVDISAPPPEPQSEWAPADLVEVDHPEWTRDAVIYEIDIRQFSESGTFEGVREQLPRLRDLGVDILRLAPIHPIGEEGRAGTLGSPGSVRDHRAVNPEFGTDADFRRLVDEAHEEGFHVIVDWVADRTARDSRLASDHPDWLAGDGGPGFNREEPDTVRLDYADPDLREHMADAMDHWVREYGVDGFSVIGAGNVPIDFWERVRPRLEAHRPVFLLADRDGRDLHRRAFDATLARGWEDALQAIARDGADTAVLRRVYGDGASAWPDDALRVTYTSSREQDARQGVPGRRLGNAYEPAAVLQFVGEGMPMIQGGQEAGNTSRPDPNERDPIAWRDHPLRDLFTRLAAFKSANPTLHNGEWGARMREVGNSLPRHIFTFVRERDGNRVVGIFNFDERPHGFSFSDNLVEGIYTDFRTGERNAIVEGEVRRLPAWGWQVLYQSPEVGTEESEPAEQP